MIPKVHGYDLNDVNPVGCPFSITDYIHGNTAEEVSRAYPGDDDIPVQFRKKFWWNIAKIMVQLASVRLPKIGSIFRDETRPDSFIVGPLVETGSGPYDSAAEFYADYPMALVRHFRTREREEVEGEEELAIAFRKIAACFAAPPTQGDEMDAGFGLANFDLNANNVLVDMEFNVLAVIDWDSVITVPNAGLYRFPFLIDIGSAIPGVFETLPAIIKRQQLSREFAEVVEAAAEQQHDESINTRQIFRFSLPGFFSKEAVAFRALIFIKMRQDFVNREWLEGLKWLSQHDEAALGKFYSI